MDSQATASHEAVSSMLRIPLVTTLPGGDEHFRYAVRMAPSSRDTTAAIRGIVSYYKWTNFLVLYDGEFALMRFFYCNAKMKVIPRQKLYSKGSLQLSSITFQI